MIGILFKAHLKLPCLRVRYNSVPTPGCFFFTTFFNFKNIVQFPSPVPAPLQQKGVQVREGAENKGKDR